jgi:hypothetical protein
MDEFLRIKRACPERSELYRPPDLEMLFARYGKAKLLQDGVAVLARLRESTDIDVRYVFGMMDQYGVGLEQEGAVDKLVVTRIALENTFSRVAPRLSLSCST